MSSWPPPSGRLGRYELVAPLGQGAMGEVWEAVLVGPRGFRKPVALKLLRVAGSRHQQERLVQEARLGALLSHPNIVGTLELGEVDGRWFLAMELVRGPTVGKLAWRGPLPGLALLEVGIQTAAGLAHIHALTVDGRSGLVHRDIKPSNLLVDPSGLVRIADLGIALLAGDPEVAAGTVGFMPPEQLEGRADARSDVFALGATLYVLATGRSLFGRGPRAMAAVHDVDRITARAGFERALEEVVPGLAGVLRHALRADPRGRTETAVALGIALRRLRAGVPDGPSLFDLVSSRDGEAVVPSRQRPDAAAETLILPPATSLPGPSDPFVGRAELLARVESALEPGAVVTLHGPGGIGKTRVALELARARDEVVFCALASVESRAQLVARVAERLRARVATEDPEGEVGGVLAARGRIVVVLDNLEQLGEVAGEVVTGWRQVAPEAAFLCTSRRVLGLRDETVLPVAPLAPAPAAALLRARAPRLLEPEEEAHLSALCARLDHLPLAVELAAARLRALSVMDLQARLADALRVLTGGGPDREPRHRSLQAALDGSWSQLEGWQQRALAQLSVFVGGLTVEAAEAVLDLGPDAPWALDVLSSLVDHALLRYDAREQRFWMLELVRAYATDRLEPDERTGAELRHGRWFAQLGTAEARAVLHGPDGVARYGELARERGNTTAAARRAAARGDRAMAARAALAAWVVLKDRGPRDEGLALLEAAHAVPGELEVVRLGVARAVGLRMAGQPEVALQVLDTLVGQAPEDEVQDVLAERATARYALGLLDAAAADAEAGAAAARRVGDDAGEAACLGALARVAIERRALETALELSREAIRACRRAGGLRLEAALQINLGVVLGELGRLDEAREAARTAVAVYERAGPSSNLAIAWKNLADYVGADRGAARDALERGLRVAREVADRALEAEISSRLLALSDAS